MKTLLLSSILLALYACGAANNSDREDASDDNNSGNRNTQTFSDEEAREAINSQIFRDQGANSAIYSYAQETLFNSPDAQDPYPSILSPIPSKGQHLQDDVTIRAVDANDCGNVSTFNSINRRLGDCATKNSANELAYIWNAVDNGVAGEGNWRLVAKKGDKSVWQDQRTGLLWSDNIASADWEKASGNVAIRDQICNGANTEFSGIDQDEVVWRLPTRGDYLQADIDGARFVLSTKKEGDETVYWTANFAGDDKAWAIQHNTGVLSLQDTTSSQAVRCVGNVIK